MLNADNYSLHEWKRIFLGLKGLDEPDGRPLYKYRTSDAEFGALEEFLRNWIAAYLERHEFSYAACRPGFPALFVLYAAEWWRRRYDGSGFTWEPILKDLGVPATDWGQSQRSDCVERGLADWKLKLTSTSGFRFLGSVAVQGGLPTLLLAREHRGIGRLIGRVLRLAKTASVSPQDLQGWVESLEKWLPKSFRQPAIFMLITDVAWTVLDLKQKAGLTSEANAIETLDQKIPEWRDSFPLSIEDSHANALIEQLVKEAANLRAERQSLILPVERSLEKEPDGDWSLRSVIDLPEIISLENLSKLFAFDEEEAPRFAQLTFYSEDKQSTTSVRRLAGRPEYRIARMPWGFSGALAAKEHLLRVSAPDGRVWRAAPPKGNELDEDLPWIFSVDDSGSRLARQGSGGVAAQSAIAALPDNWSLKALEVGEVEAIGQLQDLSRNVFRFRGSVLASNPDSNVYRLRTGSAGVSDESYEWSGNQLWLDLQSPKLAFRGKPSLYQVDSNGTKRRVTGDLGFKVLGGSESRELGPVEVRYPATGELRHRARMILLPATAGVSLESTGPTSGRIILSGWRASLARTLTPGVIIECSGNDEDLALALTSNQGARTPETVDLEVFWKHTATPARLRLPFPAEGVRGFDRDGRSIPCFSHLAVQDLLGMRLMVMGTQPGSKVQLNLKAANTDIFRKYDLKSVPGSLSTEIRLSDYRREIDHLHTIDDDPDSNVILTVEISERSVYRLTIRPYEVELEEDEEGNIRIELDENRINQINCSLVQALAIALEKPGEEPLPLLKVDTGTSKRIAWNFSPEERGPGSWMIYPPATSPVQFRPALCVISGDSITHGEYAEAVATPEFDQRQTALDGLINALATDFEHPAWVQVEQLANELGHLPLAALDIWRRFVRSSKAMAALALRFSNIRSEMLLRYSDELPFSWEIIPYSDWKSAALLCERQCKSIFGEEQYDLIFHSFLQSRLAELSAEFGSLSYLLGIIQAQYFEKARAEAQVLRSFGSSAGDWLFRGADCPLMHLRRGHSSDDERWPTDFSQYVSLARNNKSVSRYLYPESLGSQDGVINLPLLLAVEVTNGTTRKWFDDPTKISQLRTCKLFDPDWFDEAFNLTIARCLADGIFD